MWCSGLSKGMTVRKSLVLIVSLLLSWLEVYPICLGFLMCKLRMLLVYLIQCRGWNSVLIHVWQRVFKIKIPYSKTCTKHYFYEAHACLKILPKVSQNNSASSSLEGCLLPLLKDQLLSIPCDDV